ncbi:MAG: DUF3857 domain-containing protein [Saonia sp.]
MVKFTLCAIAFLITGLVASQYHDFGTTNSWEKNFNSYEKDKTASAVVLLEKGNVYFEVIENHIFLIKNYYTKIKILDKKGFDQANISIPFYFTSENSEKIKDIEAFTHNGAIKTGLSREHVYRMETGTSNGEMRFTFPNIKIGSILEYKYTLVSPFFFKLEGWDFQSHIPKIYSEFNAKIPRNYAYNRSLIGSLPLMINESFVASDCFQLPKPWEASDCEVLTYAMKDVPAFKEEEFMLSSKNYASRLEFELSEYFTIDRIRKKFTKSWKDVDREFAKDTDIGGQLTKNGFFKKNVPEGLLTKGDPITRAKNIYSFIQGHYTWNGQFGIYKNVRVKEAFDARKGSIGEINISLINLLNAAGIETHLMLLSTRKNGLPKKTHPVMYDFNYIVAKTTIDGKDYLLDASEKINPFGMLPYRCLNSYGRVMDFKNESYWLDILPEKKNSHIVRAQIKFDPTQNKAFGIFDEINIGYEAVKKRKHISGFNEQSYLDGIMEGFDDDFNITSYKLFKERNHDKLVSERFGFELENVLNGQTVYLDPFLIKFFEQNPFQLEESNYPVDFGYPRNYSYQVNIEVPEGYRVESLPKKQTVAMDGNIGKLKFDHQVAENKIALFFTLDFHSPYYVSEAYIPLKELLNKVIEVQHNSLVVLKKQ